MTVFVDFIEKLPVKNQIAFGEMLNLLFEENEETAEFIEDYLLYGREIPSNIIKSIDKAFIKAGYQQFTWDNCQKDMCNKSFDGWFDEVE